MWCRMTLSTSLEGQYDVYNDLQRAESRMLLASKVQKHAILQSDEVSHTPASDDISECLVLDEVSSVIL